MPFFYVPSQSFLLCHQGKGTEVLLAKSNVLEKEYFNFLKTSTPRNASNKLKTIAEVEKEHIAKVLEELNWNKSRTARVLGITKTTLYNKLALYNIKSPNR